MTVNDGLDNLIRDWTRIGAGFGAEPALHTPDLERVLLDTARHAPGMARLFIMGATWLRRYGDLIAKHRLKRLIRDKLEPEFRPILGLLLDIAQHRTHPPEFQSIVRDLTPAESPRPLFVVERSNARLAARAERRASELSRRWGLWCEDFEFKDDALRPAHWIMEQNPGFITRADLRGDLRASVLAALEFDAGSRGSELALARAAGGSRAQVRSALSNLELSGRVRRSRTEGQRGTGIELLRVA